MVKLRQGSKRPAVVLFQKGYNARARARHWPLLRVDGVCGPQTLEASQRMCRELGALESTLRFARATHTVSVGMQRMVRWPSKRSVAQLKRAKSRPPAHPPRSAARREGLDYVSLSPSTAKSLGAKFVMRYLSRTPAKNITVSERRGLHGLGIAVGFVWETTANRATAGHAAGVADAQSAAAHARALGAPKSAVLYFAVDFDPGAHPGVIDAYFAGALSVLGKARVGVYGGYATVRHLHEALGVRWLWQTYAWSGGRWYGPAQVQQYRNGAQYDHDRTTAANAGLWEEAAA